MINITEFETVRDALFFGRSQNHVVLRIECDDEGLKEINDRVYGIKSPSRHYVEKGKGLITVSNERDAE